MYYKTDLYYFFSYLQDDTSKTELSEKLKSALKFPTAAIPQDMEAVEVDFGGNLN